MKSVLVISFLLLSGVPAAFSELAAPVAGSEAVVDVGNTICPISGDKVNAKATAVYQGKRYAFCCENCVAKFKKNPEKYLAKMASEA